MKECKEEKHARRALTLSPHTLIGNAWRIQCTDLHIGDTQRSQGTFLSLSSRDPGQAA